MFSISEVIKNREWKHNLELVKSKELGHEVSMVYDLDNFQKPRYNDEDATLLNKLVFDNLISNSVTSIMGEDFMKGNSQGLVKVKSFERNNYDIVEVTDTGKGVHKDILNEIFKKGFSTKGTTGYGLYYAQKLVHERFNGFIEVESDSDKTSFVIMLPHKR